MDKVQRSVENFVHCFFADIVFFPLIFLRIF